MTWGRLFVGLFALLAFGLAFMALLLLYLYKLAPDWYVGMATLIVLIALGAVWTLFDELRIEADMEDDNNVHHP